LLIAHSSFRLGYLFAPALGSVRTGGHPYLIPAQNDGPAIVLSQTLNNQEANKTDPILKIRVKINF